MSDQISAHVLARAAKLLAENNPDLTMRALAVLCAVALEEGQNMGAYAQATGMPTSTVSRLLLDVSETGRSAERGVGAGLLSRKPNPTATARSFTC